MNFTAFFTIWNTNPNKGFNRAIKYKNIKIQKMIIGNAQVIKVFAGNTPIIDKNMHRTNLIATIWLEADWTVRVQHNQNFWRDYTPEHYAAGLKQFEASVQ